MKKIKVMHVWKDFGTYYGVSTRFLALARGLNREKFEFSVCVFRNKGAEFAEKLTRLGVKVYSLEIPGTPPAVFLELWGLYRFLAEMRPDIVQTYQLRTNLAGHLAARMAGVPVVVATELCLKDQAPTALGRVRDRLLQPLVNRLNRKADAVIFASRAVKKDWYGENSVRGKVIYPPVLLEEEPEKEGKDDFRRAGERVIIGIVGRLAPEKGHRDLLECFPRILQNSAGAELLIVGSGPLEKRLKKLALELGIAEKVSFLGHQDNVVRFLKKMDIFVLPSHSEGIGTAVLEAMTVGLPVVATTVGGIREAVLDGETGILVPPRRPDLLAGAIIRLLEDRQLCRRMGARAKQAAVRFSRDRFVHEHEELYQRLVKNESGKRRTRQ